GSWSIPPRHAVRALNAHHVALVAAQAQFGRAEQSIHDVVRRAEAIVHQLSVAFRPDHEQRRQLTLRDAGGKLDIDLLPVVEGAQRLPRRIAAADRIAEAQVLLTCPGISYQ